MGFLGPRGCLPRRSRRPGTDGFAVLVHRVRAPCPKFNFNCLGHCLSAFSALVCSKLGKAGELGQFCLSVTHGLAAVGQRDVGWSMLILASRLVRFFADGKDPWRVVQARGLCARGGSGCVPDYRPLLFEAGYRMVIKFRWGPRSAAAQL